MILGALKLKVLVGGAQFELIVVAAALLLGDILDPAGCSGDIPACWFSAWEKAKEATILLSI